MHKHSVQLLNRLKQEEEQRQAEMVEASKKAAESGGESSSASPEGTSPARKSRQHLLDPIRRWNSFHNARDKKQQKTNTSLPYLQTLEQFRRQQQQQLQLQQHGGGGTSCERSSEIFASICAQINANTNDNYMPVVPQGSESLEKASRVLGTNIANELIALSLANIREGRSPTRKQFSSPNLIDSNRLNTTVRSRRISSDSYPSEVMITQNKITKALSTSNPEDLQVQKSGLSSPKLLPKDVARTTVSAAVPTTTAARTTTAAGTATTTTITTSAPTTMTPVVQKSPAGLQKCGSVENQPVRKTSTSSGQSSAAAATSSSRTVPRVLALRTESASEILSSSLPSDSYIGLTPPNAPQLPRRRFSVW